ncbi:hypothetical protein [Algihabitans albus]|uniref:hypothetical protein n=1 Tax=Algihabitans albus TaxID=2164067 RepID=UPI000E5CD034|nr:hypothetical protein [Algihabitans albus]
MTRRDIGETESSSGVDALIARLREEGVSAGRNRAAEIVSEAQRQAKQILDKAHAEARDRLETARREADAYRAAGEEALKTAIRDTILSMKADLMERFSSDVRRLTSQQLAEPEILRKMILEIAGRVRDEAGVADRDELEVVLPDAAIGLEELRNNPEELGKGRLTKLVLGLTGEMLRDGVTFSASEESAAGIQVKVEGKDVTLDLTDEAVADLLLQHLQPRFRAVLEGIVK